MPDGKTVAIGTEVTFDRDAEQRTIEIVGHDEADPAANRIVFSAPLARALLGAEVGDEVEFPTSGTLIRSRISVRADRPTPRGLGAKHHQPRARDISVVS